MSNQSNINNINNAVITHDGNCDDWSCKECRTFLQEQTKKAVTKLKEENNDYDPEVKCWYCNSRYCDTNKNGVWIHKDCDDEETLVDKIKEGKTIEVKWDISLWKQYVTKRPKLPKQIELNELDAKELHEKLEEARKEADGDFNEEEEFNEIMSNYLADHVGWMVKSWKFVE